MTTLIAVPFSACKNSVELESPVEFNINFDFDENYLLSWSPVANARGYLVEIKNVNTGITTETSTRRENIRLDYLDAGDYDIRVRAIGDSSLYKDSNWSAVLSFNKADDMGCIYRLINNNLEYEVYSVTSTLTELFMEGNYRGKPVTSLSANSFRNTKNLTTIEIGKNVKSIGDSAFYNCVALKNVKMPDSITYIGAAAFQNCRSLEAFRVPDGVTSLSESVFGYCRSLKEIDFNNVTEIGPSAFNGCSGFERITIPDTVVSIDKYAFSDAAYDGVGLKEVTIGSGVTYIGSYAFFNCYFLEQVNFSENSSLTSIGSAAFANDFALTSIELPDGLTKLGMQTFSGASSLESVSIPSSVTAVGFSAFFKTKMYNDAVNEGEHLLYVDHWLVHRLDLGDDYKIKQLYDSNPTNKPDTALFEEGTVGIADRVFAGSSDIEDVKLPGSFKYLGASAFNVCENLYRFDASESSLEIVDIGALAYCEYLEQVLFNHVTPRLKEIGFEAFIGCKRLYFDPDRGGQFIPETVERIASLAFAETGFYSNADEYGVIYADNWVIGCTGSYDDAGWVGPDGRGEKNIVLKDGVKGIAEYGFNNCIELETIENTSQVEIIGRGAFYQCINLMGVTLNPNLPTIEAYSFYGCVNLTLYNFPRDLQSIGRSAFYNCRQMQEIDLERLDLLEFVDEYAFYGCGNVTKLQIGSRLTEISPYAFYGCSRLNSVTIPGNIKKVGKSAFSRCLSLEELIIEEGVEEIGPYAFNQNRDLLEINLPNSVKTVGYAAFLNCRSVRSIDLANVETIGDYAFAMNTSVTDLVIPDSVKSIGTAAFYSLGAQAVDEDRLPLGGVRSVVISGGLDRMDAHAFYGCNVVTFYIEGENKSAEWGTGWNSSRRPVVWGVNLSEDGTYVTSLTVQADTFEYYETINAPAAPYRAGYSFLGWSRSENGTEIAYTARDVMKAPVGTKLYAVYMQA